MRAPTKQRRVLRVYLLAATFLAWFALIFGRLVQLQVYQHDDLARMAQRQQLDTIEVPAGRGAVYDRRMHEMAVSLEVQSVYANPQEIQEPAKVAEMLAPILSLEARVLAEKLNTGKSFVWLKRKVDFAVEQQLRNAKLPGIRFIKEGRRFYPNQELAGQLLGFVGMDDQGLAGLELQYDQDLRGSPGLYQVVRDAKQKILGSEIRRKSVTGNTLVINIDKTIQFIVEQELTDAVVKHQARGGMAIVMDPHTGQVLALASAPGMDPNRVGAYPVELQRSRAVTDVYEPGSIFKIATFSSAFEEQILKPTELIDCQMGSITLANHTVKDHTPLGALDYRGVISHSSNVGAIKVGLRLGAERFYRRISSLGLGRRTGIDLPGEVPGLLRKPRDWSGVSSGFIAMGYEIGVTPLQMLVVLSAVANGGYWVKPHLVEKVISPEGDLIREAGVERVQVLSPHTVSLMREALEQVVEEGTGKAAAPPSYHVAGKTGTAKKQENGGYNEARYMASFLGYAPADPPVIAAIVVIDDPSGRAYYGGEVAAPVFRGVADKVLRYLEVPPDRQPPTERFARIPPREVRPAIPIPPEPIAEAAVQEPDSLTAPLEGSELIIVDAANQGAVLPDFRGKNLREVLERCAELDIVLHYQGTGVAVDQQPRPGARLLPNMTLKVSFSRHTQAKAAAPLNNRDSKLAVGRRTVAQQRPAARVEGTL